MGTSGRPFVQIVFIHLLLFTAGVGIVLHYGPVGFFPINQSIVFDGGWRILSGQVPFRDFTAPNAIVPSIMQAGFFATCGVTWGTYILHAAVMNGLFCIVAFWFLRAFKLSVIWSAFYTLLTGIFFYAPSGVPYMEQHAFFFSILALACLFWSGRVRNPKISILLLTMVPPLFLLAYLSKQIPTLLFIAFAILYLLLNWNEGPKRKAVVLTISVILSMLVVALIFWIWGSHWELIRLYLFELPASMGFERMHGVFQRREVGEFLQQFSHRWFVFVLIACVAAGYIVLWRRKNKSRDKYFGMFAIFILIATAFSILSIFAWGVFSILVIQLVILYLVFSNQESTLSPARRNALWISEAFILIGLIFIGLTNMVPGNGIPWLMIALGLVHSALPSSGKFSKVFATALVVVALIDSALFNYRINEPRAALFLTPEGLSRLPVAPALPGPLEAMRGPVYPAYSFTARDLSELVNYLHRQSGNFWYFGDASVVYGATGKPSVDPALWYHFGLTIPLPGSKDYTSYQERLLASLKLYDVQRIILEDSGTMAGCGLSDFSKISQFVKENAVDTELVAGFRVIRLRPSPFIMP